MMTIIINTKFSSRSFQILFTLELNYFSRNKIADILFDFWNGQNVRTLSGLSAGSEKTKNTWNSNVTSNFLTIWQHGVTNKKIHTARHTLKKRVDYYSSAQRVSWSLQFRNKFSWLIIAEFILEQTVKSSLNLNATCRRCEFFYYNKWPDAEVTVPGSKWVTRLHITVGR